MNTSQGSASDAFVRPGYYLAPLLLFVNACCGPSHRATVTPQAVLTMLDGEPLLGVTVVDLDRVESDPHCGGSTEIQGAAVMMLRADASVLGFVPIRVGDLVDGIQHARVPQLVGVGVPSPDGPVAMFGEDGVDAVASGEGVVLVTHRDTSPPVRPFARAETSFGVTGWSATGAVWTHTGLETDCSVFMDVRTSPNGRYALMNRTTICRSGRVVQAQTLTTADGAFYGAAYDFTARYLPPRGGIADDGSSLVFSPDDSEWLHRSPEGDILARLPNPDVAPMDAFAWGDDWLVRSNEGTFTLMDRAGTVLATTRLNVDRDTELIVTNDGLWVLESRRAGGGRSLPSYTYCLAQYNRSLEPLEPVCLREADLQAAYDTARSG